MHAPQSAARGAGRWKSSTLRRHRLTRSLGGWPRRVWIAACFGGWALLELALWPATLRAAEGGLEASGALQTDLGGQYLSSDPATDTDGSLEFAGTSLLTLNVRNRNRQFARLDGSVDLIALYGRYAALLQGDPGAGATAVGSSPLFWELRRLSMRLYLPIGDVELGRQILNFGQGRVYSPIDVFSSVDLLELSFRRRGSDAARWSRALGELGGLEAVIGYPIGEGEHSTAFKVFGHLAGWDLALVSLHQHVVEQTRLALTFKGDLEVGVYGELVPRYAWKDEALRLEAMLGVDYSVEGVVMLGAEYYYRDPELEPHSFYDTHNLYASATVRFNELLSGGLAGLGSWPANRLLLTAQLQYNILQNADLILYARRYAFPELGASIPDYELAARVTVKY